MRNADVKLTIAIALVASATLATVILMVPAQNGGHFGAVFLLWTCGLLAGMSWQVLICRRHDDSRAAAGHDASKDGK